MQKNKNYTTQLVLTSIFTAITVVLNRFLSVNVWNMSIGFAFVSVLFCGMLLGPLWGGLCGGVADFIGAIVLPFGTYFPGFTLTAFVVGILFGVIGFLAKKRMNTVIFMVLSTLLILLKEVACSLLLNSLWISILYQSRFVGILISRIPLCATTFVLEVILAFLLKKFLIPKVKKELF